MLPFLKPKQDAPISQEVPEITVSDTEADDEYLSGQGDDEFTSNNEAFLTLLEDIVLRHLRRMQK